MKLIAEDGHVYSAKKGFLQIGKTDGKVRPERMGVADASTFPGFCNHHDTAMFEPVESNDAALTERNAFLLSFRALCYELATKQAVLRISEHSRHRLDRGVPYKRQVGLQTFFFFRDVAFRKSMGELTKVKTLYDAAYLTDDLSPFRFYGLTFDTVLPFVGAGALMPVSDFLGNQLQRLDDGSAAEILTLNVTTIGGQTVLVMGWIGSATGPAEKLVASFAALPDDRKADAILELALVHLENVYLRPSWWSGLAPDVREGLDSKIGFHVSATPGSRALLGDMVMDVLSAGVASTIEKR
ncbi:TPA: hypothetical protein ACUNF5_003884 [Burkholderia orbicola]|uniref:hypothetical protein n=1 Tax=Burkholderia cenocepacia TaxID=95486 RepID=UPI000F5AAD7F|nr:hypothetical protein [Burkholderia cenocepacia]MBR8155459.1 hypothetical protein [Burkholderia cenocepacia]